MARQRYLPHAPITEALIDIQVTPREGLDFAGLKDALDAAKFDYYLKGPISFNTFAINVATNGQLPQTTTESQQLGLRFHSTDEKYVAQCRLNGFTLSRLPPYEKWSNLVDETRRIWKLYIELLGPTRVTRVATRFINNLNLPIEPGGSYQKYLCKFVDVPEEAPQAVEAFVQRFQLVDVDTGARMALTLALDGMSPDGTAPVMLDLDAFTGANLHPADEQLWSILERLRDLKNRSFFGTITETTAELYE